MRVQYYTASSLDGFIADERNSLDWLLELGMPEDGSYPAFISEVGALVMGSTTYQWLLDHEVRIASADPSPWPYQQPCFVFSTRTLPKLSEARISFVEGDVAQRWPDIRDAANGKNVWVVGGGDLAGQFLEAGLLDEIVVQVAPVALGAGAPLLPRRIVGTLELQTASAMGPFVEIRYDVKRF